MGRTDEGTCFSATAIRALLEAMKAFHAALQAILAVQL